MKLGVSFFRLSFWLSIVSVYAVEPNHGPLADDLYCRAVQEGCVQICDPIGLHFKKIVTFDDGCRLTSLRIFRPFMDGEFSEGAKVCLKDGQTFKSLGKIHLTEYPDPKPYQTHFMLDFLYVFEGNQGQGIGPKALTCLKGIVAHLSQQSLFYQTLGLLSQDVDYHIGEHHIHLPKVPRRVDFYMKSGFQIHPETEALIQFLDIGHMARQMTVPRLADYMAYYVVKGMSKAKVKEMAKQILPGLIAHYQTPVALEYLIACVRCNGNEASIHILDRAYYREGVSDERQNMHNKFAYFLTWTVGQEPDQRGLSLDDDVLLPQQFLTLAEGDNKFELLQDQVNFNQVIRDLCDMLPKKRGRPVGSRNKKRGLSDLNLSQGHGESQSKRIKFAELGTTDLDHEWQDDTESRSGLSSDQGQ